MFIRYDDDGWVNSDLIAFINEERKDDGQVSYVLWFKKPVRKYDTEFDRFHTRWFDSREEAIEFMGLSKPEKEDIPSWEIWKVEKKD